MKKYPRSYKSTYRIILVLVTILLIFLLGACFKDQGSTPNKKKWTFMFYDDEDFDPPYHRFYLFMNAMCSGENLNVLVFRDTHHGPARYYYIDEDYQDVRKKEMGEINMGNYSALHDFLHYAKENYPAERYILSLYNHGGGWIGACWDFTDNYDWLSPDDMQVALRKAGGVDLIFFSGACLMGAVETAYELRDLANVYVASENRNTYAFWDEPMRDICQILNSTPDISTFELAETVVDLILRTSYGQWHFENELTMSAVRMDKMDDLIQGIDELSLKYLENLGAFRSHISTVFRDVQDYRGKSIDLYDLTHELLKVEADTLIRNQLEVIQECLKEVVIAECHGDAMDGSHGLSIYFPNPDSTAYNSFYNDDDFSLDFARASHWDELLISYFGITKQKIIKVVPEPPRGHLYE